MYTYVYIHLICVENCIHSNIYIYIHMFQCTLDLQVPSTTKTVAFCRFSITSDFSITAYKHDGFNLPPFWSRWNMTFERTLIYSLHTSYSFYFRMVVYTPSALGTRAVSEICAPDPGNLSLAMAGKWPRG